MRFQSWQLEVLVDGAPLEEHTIDGRVCVQAQPGNEFGVRARYLESGQYFFLELLLDGNPVTGLKWIDAVGDTITPQTEYTFSAWEKIVEGHRTRQRLCFEKTDAASEESRPAGQRSWDRGRFTLRVHKAHRDVCTRDSMSRDFKADLSKKKMDMDESTMVKNGLSTSVGTGEIRFEKLGGFRAGQVIVRQDPAREVLCELEIFFRDSFFMALNDDTCCDGKCAAKAASSVRERASAVHSGSGKAAMMRERLVEMRETAEALRRKRPADEGAISLCSSDEEDEDVKRRRAAGSSSNGAIDVD